MTKIIISDYDRTLLREDGTISQRSKETIQRIKDAGILFGIATGRKSDNIYPALKREGLFDLCDLIISANGAEIYDQKTKEIKHSHWITRETIVKINDHFKHRENIVYFLEDETTLRTAKENVSATRISDKMGLNLEYIDIENIEDIEYPKVLFSVTEEDQEWMNNFVTTNDNLYGTYGFSTHKEVYEFVDVRVSKFKALAEYCEKYGIDMMSVLSFGDSNNDLELLEKSGRGVAVKNSTPEAIKVSDYITKSNDEDGVAHYIEKYLLEGNENA